MRAEQDHHQLEQRTQEPEVREANDRGPQHAVAPEAHQTVRDFAERVPVEGLPRRGRGHAPDAQAGDRAEYREHQRERADQPQAVAPDVEQVASRRRAGHDRHERAHLEQSVRA